MKKKIVYILISVVLFFTSCSSYEKVAYMQDVTINNPQKIENIGLIKIKPEDVVSINVHSKNPELSAVFNLPRLYYMGTSMTVGGSSTRVCGYLVDKKGNIDFPIIGFIHVEGLTRTELSSKVRTMLKSKGLVKDAVVTVDFMNLNYSLLGEVKRPGKYDISKDKISILDAISEAGDLSVQGDRSKVYVTRESNGKRTVYQLDLRYKDKLFNSQAFYIQQGDVIYVAPNKVAAAAYNRNENYVKSVSFWLSMASFLTSLGVIIF